VLDGVAVLALQPRSSSQAAGGTPLLDLHGRRKNARRRQSDSSSQQKNKEGS
jgi:hypothetical protein